MKITYAITVCNEQFEIIRLVEMILNNKRPEDDIVVLYDQSNGNSEIPDWLTKKSKLPGFQFWRGFFKGHFADWKNKLTEYCSGDYIFQIDADELIHKDLPKYLPEIFSANPDIDVYRVGRKNLVEGLTLEHVREWGWTVNEVGYINYPDYQWRIYKNNKEIIWVNKVHEVLKGYNQYTELPPNDVTCLIHNKTIERQIKQNKYYSNLV